MKKQAPRKEKRDSTKRSVMKRERKELYEGELRPEKPRTDRGVSEGRSKRCKKVGNREMKEGRRDEGEGKTCSFPEIMKSSAFS